MLLHHFQEIFRDRIAGTFANYRIYAAIGANGRAESIACIVLDDPLGDLAGMKNFQTEKATADAVPLKPLHVVVAEFMGLEIVLRIVFLNQPPGFVCVTVAFHKWN